MRTEPKLTRLDRIFARLDREPERPVLDVPRMTRHRVVLFGATLAFYLTIVLAVVTTSWLVRFDWQAMLFRPYQQWPEIHAFLDYWVVLGQRGPTAVMVAAWLGWRSWRQHTLRPLLAFGAALLLLNVSVGAVKYGLGRSGPHYATEVGSNEMWHWFQAGSDIFPSGHTANAVVTWGILAYLATSPRARRWLSALSAVLSLSVGLTTVYLGTHWLSDVLLGWTAGLLILLGLPWFEPPIARAEAWLLGLRDRWPAGASRTTPQAAPVPATVPVTVAPLPASEEEAPPRETVSQTAARPPRAPVFLAPGPHTTRAERTPVSPAGSRRPQHPERATRGSTPAARPLTGG
ncbi:phosphatase PAP2 family protein [Streptomyces chromofuscus]|uniref:Phosphatase PAP2 family protein n=1 Tax=Streptomyces chromofuscus TaxID=42881 RepID=A0A7M2TC51_STRCW|nr:phosphatase PAP2 family protein [Streptomyces chromofuscus]QOV45834.1 phosphatase PAP2 family protein [Streptomyces chromofuscus]GGT18254.1 membrane protein [Streptomyces chromofuscus]